MTYLVIRTSDGATVYRYSAPQPIEWLGMEFATHDHVAEPEPTPNPPPTVYGGRRILSRIEFLRLLTVQERVAIRALAKTNPVADDFMALLEAAMEVDLNNTDVAMGLKYLTEQACLAVGRAEVIRGG